MYHITQTTPDGTVSLYVGKSGNLRRRIYDNHYTGNRGGSGLRANLLTDGLCPDEAAVTAYLGGCHVQYVLVEGAAERTCLEHFVIALLRPRANR